MYTNYKLFLYETVNKHIFRKFKDSSIIAQAIQILHLLTFENIFLKARTLLPFHQLGAETCYTSDDLGQGC